MLRYDVAVSGSRRRTSARARATGCSTYNRGDVEATLAIRDWLERDGALIPRNRVLGRHVRATTAGASTLGAAAR